jgi:acyl-CoA thioester hydrolase
MLDESLPDSRQETAVAIFVHERRIEFSDTDLAGIVHFANYYRFMEQAEHALFRQLQLKIHGESADGTTFGWPRVACSCSFRAPARYDDLIQVHVSIAERGERTLLTRYVMRREELLLAEGEMKTVYCRMQSSGRLQSAVIPDDVAEALDRFAALP